MYKIIRSFRDLKKLENGEIVKHTFLMVTKRGAKHYDPKWKWHRNAKYVPPQLPDYHEKMTKEKMRSQMKEWGLPPPRFWRDRPLTITTLSEIVEPYEPPEADGKASILNRDVLKNAVSSVKSKKKEYSAIKLIKSYDGNFSMKTFPQEAHDIYVKAHTLLMDKDPEKLSDIVTERAIIEMMDGLKRHTLRWKFLESLEPPVVVQVRTSPAVVESNHFAQVTVRFHTKQTLALYDRFGRLFYGSEVVPKDVLEYVVFEKHIVNEYGIWRMHGKIIPDWMPKREPAVKTYRVEPIKDENEEEEDFVEEDREPLKHTTEVVTEEKNASTAG